LLALVNQQEQAALEYRFADFPDGAFFANPAHAYSSDLDLFGPHSIFQFCNRTVTVSGSQQLAQYLEHPAAPELIQARQVAVQELATLLDWRQHFRAYGLERTDKVAYQVSLQKWLQEPSFVYNRPWMRWALVLLPIWAIAALVVILPNYPLLLVLVAVLPAALLLRQTFAQVNLTIEHTAKAETWLLRYAVLIQQIENLEVKTELLQKLRHSFRDVDSQYGASKAIRRLSYCLSQLNVRNNPFAIVLNLVGVWDLQWVYQLEKWKAEYQTQLPRWFAALGELDALCSLANLHYNQPDWVFPTLHTEAVLQAQYL
jgi:DNA mismatch repair ATPase MutS